MVAYRNKTPYGNAPAVGGPSGAAMGFFNKQTGKHYASPQEAYAASQGAGAGGSGAPQGPQGVGAAAAGAAWSKATGNPYFGPGSYRGSHSQPAANVQEWYSKYGPGATRGGVGGGGAAAGGAPQGPAGMAGGGGGYDSTVPENVDQARKRMLGNISQDRGVYHSPQAQSLMGNIHSTAMGGPSPMMNLLDQTTQGARASMVDANARALQQQQQQMAQVGDRAGINTGAAQTQAMADSARNMIAQNRELDMSKGAASLRLMGAAEDKYAGALRDMGAHARGVTSTEAPIMAQMFDIEEDAFGGWQGALSGGSVTGNPGSAGPYDFQMSGGGSARGRSSGTGGAGGAGGGGGGRGLSHSEQDAAATYKNIANNMTPDGAYDAYNNMPGGYRKRQLRIALQQQGLWDYKTNAPKRGGKA